MYNVVFLNFLCAKSEYARKVYLAFPDFQIVQTRLRNLTWSHLYIIASVQERMKEHYVLLCLCEPF